jgi:predicted nucleic acid-binding protein
MAIFVLDTSAIMCLLFQEEGADLVVEILDAAGNRGVQDETLVLVPFIALMETEYWLRRRLPAREVETTLLLVESWPIQVMESTPEWRHEAARIKAAVSLSVADAWIASLATLHQGELIHKDPEFEGVKMLGLPRRRDWG